VIGAGDEIVLSVDGNRENALGFVIRTFKHFHHISEMAPIPLGQRVIPTDKELFGIRGYPISHGHHREELEFGVAKYRK
jgi:hypothetical protein